MLARRPDAPFAIRGGQTISCGNFLGAALDLSKRLPDRPQAINLCADRYAFMVSFVAVVLRGQCNLLPPARRPAVVSDTLSAYPEAYVLRDGAACAPGAPAPEFVVDADRLAAGAPRRPARPAIDADLIAAVVFTSGSTGVSQALPKSWRTLAEGALVNSRHVPGDAAALCGMVATVPPWHMYGLEWSLMLPLVRECAVYCGEAFYPADILRALESAPAARVLVSTPLHLRAMVRSKLSFPAVRHVVCATAPLDAGLARDAERLLSAEVFEIYGCSEAGSMACRWPSRDPRWRFFSEFRPEESLGGVRVSAAHLPAPVQLADTIEFLPDGLFLLHGRTEDLVKIGGRRASLVELNNRLLALKGVDDGVVFHPASLGLADTGRLAALVVSKSRSAGHIRRELASLVDGVFVPRPIRLVEALPRSATGKLRRTALLELLGGEPGP